MLLPVGARCPWKLIGFLVLTGAVASSLDWTDPINESFPELHRREDVHVEPAEPLELRLQVDQYMAHVLGIQGAAFMAFMLAAVMLIRGAWLLTDFVGYRIHGFVLCQCFFVVWIPNANPPLGKPMGTYYRDLYEYVLSFWMFFFGGGLLQIQGSHGSSWALPLVSTGWSMLQHHRLTQQHNCSWH